MAHGSLWAPPELRRGDLICLPPEEAHHALRVMRLRPGDESIVVDGEGGWFRAALEGSCSVEALPAGLWEAYQKRLRGDSTRPAPVQPKEALGSSPLLALRILEERREVGEPPWRLTLGQAVGKGRKFELVVEKGTELGVAVFIPLVTERVIVRGQAPLWQERRRRWERVALAAVKQCGRSRIPAIKDQRDLPRLVQHFGEYDAVLLASETEAETTLEEAFHRALLSQEHAGRAGGRTPLDTSLSVLALVGPEGGFTPAETGAALAKGAIPVTLGPRRLRTETAGIVIAALVAAALSGLKRASV